MKKEEREFQLRMMAMIMQAPQAPVPSPYPLQYMQALPVYPPTDYNTNPHDEF